MLLKPRVHGNMLPFISMYSLSPPPTHTHTHIKELICIELMENFQHSRLITTGNCRENEAICFHAF